MTARIIPIHDPTRPAIKREPLRSGGTLILAAGFVLPGYEKPEPAPWPEDGFVDSDEDGQHV